MATSFQVTFDCADPDALASFWAQALGYVVQPPPEGFSSWEDFLEHLGVPEEEWGGRSAIVDPAGMGPRVFFQRVPEGKTAKNRVHLDVNVSAGTPREQSRARVADEASRLVALGAEQVHVFDEGHEHWIVMRDPEGNEFCLQ
jgi:hypothetical protein